MEAEDRASAIRARGVTREPAQDIIETDFEGLQTPELTANKPVRLKNLPIDWAGQADKEATRASSKAYCFNSISTNSQAESATFLGRCWPAGVNMASPAAARVSSFDPSGNVISTR